MIWGVRFLDLETLVSEAVVAKVNLDWSINGLEVAMF